VGAEISMPVVSVTATENLMMAASLARGVTNLVNAAREPEIVDLAKCLNAMGARITGAGTGTITIEGVEKLHRATHSVIVDRIEMGTYVMAALITGGALKILGGDLHLLPAVSSALEQSGAQIRQENDGVYVASPANGLVGVDAMTEPFPGFATDLQAQFMALMTLSAGASMITETIFENRFMHVPELCRMGANITVHGSSALVRGVKYLSGAPVMATDLRASVSLILAALAARGETTLGRVYHLDRGYEKIEEKLNPCGAHIERVVN
jgi:UDP-N-acetylglucosamine 1-carboxyvinyltransferase